MYSVTLEYGGLGSCVMTTEASFEDALKTVVHWTVYYKTVGYEEDTFRATIKRWCEKCQGSGYTLPKRYQNRPLRQVQEHMKFCNTCQARGYLPCK
jgi:DnaJ-class molecular chaperone